MGVFCIGRIRFTVRFSRNDNHAGKDEEYPVRLPGVAAAGRLAAPSSRRREPLRPTTAERAADAAKPPALTGHGRSDRLCRNWENRNWRTRNRQTPNARAFRNEGVGEHVRTRFHVEPEGPVKLRSSEDPHRTKKTSFFCRTGFRWSVELVERSIQPFDLMSRRHPLSSTRAAWIGISFEKRNVREARVTCRHQVAGNFLSESYFFFLATLRVFFAVFFTALFAFFAFLAFLAMLPS